MTETCWMTGIDWSAVGSVLQGVGTLTGAIAVIVAAKVGSSTFDNWRQQKLSERRIEQAERILTATYKARRGLSYVRNPMIWAHELVAAEEKLKESGNWPASENEQSRLKTAQAYYNRLNAELDNRRALEECQPMARALFSEELEKAMELLNQQFHMVRVFVDANARDRGNPDSKFSEKIDAAIFEGYPSPEENEMDKTIAEQVKVVEGICVPVLRLESGPRGYR